MTKTERVPATRPEKSRGSARTKPALPAGPDYWPLPTQYTARRRRETRHLPGEARPTPAP
jgi:hypothetical protein